MIGRPTIMTPEILEKLREGFLMGFTDKEACLYADIGESTLYDYQKDNPDFSEQKELFKLNPVFKARKTIYDEIEKGNTKIAMWFLERKKRDEFGKTVDFKPIVDIEEELNKLERMNTDYEKLAEALDVNSKESFPS